jgi:hypothetical protein
MIGSPAPQYGFNFRQAGSQTPTPQCKFAVLCFEFQTMAMADMP